MSSLASFAFSIDNENPFVNKRFIAKQKVCLRVLHLCLLHLHEDISTSHSAQKYKSKSKDDKMYHLII